MAVDSARAKSLFLVASDLSDPVERAAYLDRECGDDAELRGRVEALLRANDASPLPPPATEDATIDSEPGRPVRGGTDLPTSEPDLDPPPVSITADFDSTALPNALIAGRYTLQQKIGEGGMGEVWVAKQSEPVKRKVALKLIKPGMDSRAVLQRFEQERQALAMMDHPNIAKVLDAGMTPNGQPFFVMELVNGLPLNKFCDELKLTPRERLELFVPICQAVQHAHQKGIVHRDLKPANILITMIDGKPVPKVIDFGVAKATWGKLTDESMSTQFGSVVGTLEYMSPEQAGFSGEDIDTRSDIYSLGVILYELLTGLRPIDAKRLRNAALTEMIRIIREEEPSKPSTRLSTDQALPSLAALRQTEPRKLMKLLRGELDWVVMKCLEKHRERRYETASGLARDIQRYLADEAVEARPPSAGYRISKFVRRHKGQVIAASLVLLAVLGGLAAVAAVQTVANARLAASLTRETNAKTALNTANEKLVESRAAVEARYDLAVRAIETFHTGVSEEFLLKEDKFKALRDRLLNSASDFYGRLGALLGKETDPASRRALAQANFKVAELTRKVGRKEAALAAHRAVLALREELAADPAADALAKIDVGRSLTAAADLLKSTGKTDEAGATYRKAEALLADLALRSAAAPAARAALADCRSSLGGLLSATGKSADALEAYRLARADQEALAAAPGATNEARRGLAHTIYSIGVLLSNTGKPREAEAEYRKTIAIQQKLVDDNPAVTQFRSDLAGSHNDLGIVLSATGKPSEAEAEYRTAIAIQQKLAEDNPAVTQFHSRLAGSHNNLGLVLSATGKRSEAETEYREAIAIQQKLAAENPAASQFRVFLANHHHNLGVLLSATGKPREAEAEYRTAIVLYQKLADDNPAVTQFRGRLANSRNNLGLVLSATGKPREAEAEYRTAIAIQQKLAYENPTVTEIHSSLAGSRNNLGLVLSATGKSREAEAEFRKAIAIQQKLVDDNPSVTDFRSNVADSHADFGWALSAAGKLSEAEAEYRKAIAIQQKLADDNPVVIQFRGSLAGSHNSLGLLLSRKDKSSEAETEYRKALALRQKLADDYPAVTSYQRNLADSLLTIGWLLAQTGKTGEAIGYNMQEEGIRQKLADAASATPADRDSLANCQTNIADVLRRSRKLDEALAACTRAVAVREPLVQAHADVSDYRAGLGETYLRLGQVRYDQVNLAEAAAGFSRACALYEGVKSLSGEHTFLLACCRAGLAALAGRPGSGISLAEGANHAEKAISLLRQAVANGYRKPDAYRTDTALDPLRKREDFKKLIDELEKPSPAKPEQ